MTVSPELPIGMVLMRLPLRLVPREGTQVILFLFFLLFIGITLPVFHIPQPARSSGGFYVMLVFLLPFAGIGIVGCTIAVLKCLPRSPYYNIELTSDSFTLRNGLSTKRFHWSELGPFDVAVFSNDGDQKQYWIAALPGAEAGRRCDGYERYLRSAVRFRAADYCGENETDSRVMAEWLTAIQSHVANASEPLQDIAVPFDHRDRAFELGGNDALAAAEAPNRG